MNDGRGGDRGAKRPPLVSRRSFLKGGLAVGAGSALGSSGLTLDQGRLIERLAGASQAQFTRGAVKNVVILMQENRSFDHYFGTLGGVAGYRDPNAGRYQYGATSSNLPYGSFYQPGPLGPGTALPAWNDPGHTSLDGTTAYLAPWRLQSFEPTEDPTSTPFENGQCTNDITHEWSAQHRSWNGGAMDQWFAVHSKVDTNGISSSNDPLAGAPANDGYMTMGYLAQPDLSFYHALADVFTICDGYFCSVMGPTDPNRLMLMSNSVGIGQQNGPLLSTLTNRAPEFGKFAWETMPEALNAARNNAGQGVSWKVYGDPTAQYLFNVLPYFKNYETDPSLAANAFGYGYPYDFAADVAAGTLPQVSWILPPAVNCEHPAAPPSQGEALVSQILDLLMNSGLWESTVFFLVYDENGGFFDHVPPPTAPDTQTNVSEGEYLTGANNPDTSKYDNGPLGLGFRVPCLIMSPFSMGGFVCTPYSTTSGVTHLDPAATFDHTSLNRFIAAVFGAQGYPVSLPNLSSWRQSVTGDFTKAFPQSPSSNVAVPPAPDPIVLTAASVQSVVNGIAGTEGYAPQPYTPPTDDHTFPPALEAAPSGGSFTSGA